MWCEIFSGLRVAGAVVVVLVIAADVPNAASSHSKGAEKGVEGSGSGGSGSKHRSVEGNGDSAAGQAPEAEEEEEGEKEKREKPVKEGEGRKPLQFNRASSLIGMPVVNAKHEELGQIHDLVFDLEAQRVHYLVFATGGILGFGEKLLVLPVEAVVPHPMEPALIVNVEKKALAEAKGLDSGSWPSIEQEELPGAELWGNPPGKKSISNQGQKESSSRSNESP